MALPLLPTAHRLDAHMGRLQNVNGRILRQEVPRAAASPVDKKLAVDAPAVVMSLPPAPAPIGRAVCVYCASSRIAHPDYRAAARRLGEVLAAEGVGIVY